MLLPILFFAVTILAIASNVPLKEFSKGGGWVDNPRRALPVAFPACLDLMTVLTVLADMLVMQL